MLVWWISKIFAIQGEHHVIKYSREACAQTYTRVRAYISFSVTSTIVILIIAIYVNYKHINIFKLYLQINIHIYNLQNPTSTG